MKTIRKTVLSILVIFYSLIPVQSFAQWRTNTSVASSPEVLLFYSYQWITAGKGHQDLKIVCQNITTDKITFKISYDVYFHNGKVESVTSSNLITLKPAQTLNPKSVADWGGVYKRFFLGNDRYGKKDQWFKFGKDKYGNPLYTPITSVKNMKIIDLKRIPEKEPDEPKTPEIEKKQDVNEDKKEQTPVKEAKKNTGNTAKKDKISGGEKKLAESEKAKTDGLLSGAPAKKTTTTKKDNSNDVKLIPTKVELDYKTQKYLLKKSDGELIREISFNDNKNLSKIDKDGFYYSFVPYEHVQGYIGKNARSIMDNTGKILNVGGEKVFADIVPDSEGGFTLQQYLSESIYKQTMRRGPRGDFKQTYTDAAAASAYLDEWVAKKMEEEARRTKGDGYVLSYDTNYNVVKMKEIKADSNMKLISSKTFYKIE